MLLICTNSTGGRWKPSTRWKPRSPLFLGHLEGVLIEFKPTVNDEGKGKKDQKQNR